MRAVVFAYHDVGVRCLEVLLAGGVEVVLVVTHEDNPAETIWFASVAMLCREHGTACITPDDPASPALLAQVKAARPDILFSFYYRHMLPLALLEIAPAGAFNMHGSLLPKYRGRVPVNWAVLHGETETGATLHEMVVKPDAGAIVAQTAVAILPDDTAHDVFGKVVSAAVATLQRSLPALLSGNATRLPNDLSQGSYFGGRNADDGRIDWSQPARSVYNLVRAVAPPYPGAWTLQAGRRLIIAEARLIEAGAAPVSALSTALYTAADTAPDSSPGTVLDRARRNARHKKHGPGLVAFEDRIYGVCGDGELLDVRRLLIDGRTITAAGLLALSGLPDPAV